ncbi:hypothetical protein WNY81_03570 [Shewanella frigidimarina]|uniref:hypothetical protein n=1 Tax=Shewanella frigidimarina TaxID=56812 RepID=UPI003173B481
MKIYFLVSCCLLFIGVILGQGVEFDTSLWLGFISLVFTIATLGIAYRAYKVWRVPILTGYVNSLSEIMMEREIAFSNLSYSMLKGSKGGEICNVVMFAEVSHFINVDRGLWLRGLFLIEIINKSIPDSASFLNFWLEYQLDKSSSYEPVILDEGDDKNYDLWKEIMDKHSELQPQIWNQHNSLSTLIIMNDK